MNHRDYHTAKENNNNQYVMNADRMSMQNADFRNTIWTGCYSQMTLMCIPVCSDIGLEIHEDTDQIIRIEQGFGMVQMGECRDDMDYQRRVCRGDIIFVPSGMWHNVVNIGRIPMRVSTVYAPPHHPAGTVHKTKKDAQMEYNED